MKLMFSSTGLDMEEDWAVDLAVSKLYKEGGEGRGGEGKGGEGEVLGRTRGGEGTRMKKG